MTVSTKMSPITCFVVTLVTLCSCLLSREILAFATISTTTTPRRQYQPRVASSTKYQQSVTTLSLFNIGKNTNDNDDNEKDESFDSPTGLTCRQVGELGVAAVGTAITAVGTAEVDPTDYGLWYCLLGHINVRRLL